MPPTETVTSHGLGSRMLGVTCSYDSIFGAFMEQRPSAYSVLRTAKRGE